MDFGIAALCCYAQQNAIDPRSGAMTSALTARFLELHHGDSPLLLPNPWDVGSAKILQNLGFHALATTSSGLASTLGRLDGAVTREETLAHAAALVAAVTVPVTADLVNGFADDPAGVAECVRGAVATGLAGCSIEDFTEDESKPIYEKQLAVERVAAAVEAADKKLVLTARTENYLHGAPDLADTIARLQAFQEVGADVLYAPGVTKSADIAAILSEVDRPVNVLLLPGGPNVAELAELGVARISIGGAFAYAAINGLVEAATEFRDQGTTGYSGRAAKGREAARAAFRVRA
jgi:2-methylisocitrate lyase-like PEP mutase family enzyme